MGKQYRFSGIIGLIVLVFGILGGFVVKNFSDPFILGHLVIGGLLLVFWFAFVGVTHINDASSIMSGRASRFGINAVLYSVVFIGILSILNWYVSKNDKRWDLTEEGAFSLSSQSVNVLQGLKKPLKLVLLTGINMRDEEEVRERLELYKYANPDKVKFELLNPQTKPHLVEQYGIKQGNLIYIEYGEGESKAVSRINETTEESITNSIIKLSRGEAKKIYFVTGHDEPDIASAEPMGLKDFKDAIVDEHLKAESIFLGEKDKVPDDAAAIILVSPKKQLIPAEKEMLIKYVEDGGRLVLFTDPRTTNDIRDIGARFNIEVGADVVIDQVQRLFAGPTLAAQPIIKDYGKHRVTEGFTQRHITVFNIASTVISKGKSEGDVSYTELVKTSPTAWGETNLAAVFDRDEPTAVMEDSDKAGPVSMGVVYEKKLSNASESKEEPTFQKGSRLIIYGDSDFILNANLHVYANRDLALNSLNWLVGEEGGVSIRPRSVRLSTAPMSRETFLTILAMSFLVPEIILILGLYIWWRRRTVFA